MKKDELYIQLLSRLREGQWLPRQKLPTEVECGKQFGVSRDTVRLAFGRLEKEGYLERVKAKGTFVRLPSIAPPERTISILVPCIEYLQCIVCHFQQMLFELVAEAAKVGWRVSPVIFSRTNNSNDIWWENLAHFTSESRIVVNRGWFSTYFRQLSALQARIAFISNEQPAPPEWIPYVDGWKRFIEHDIPIADQALDYLQAMGCRRPALAMGNATYLSNTLWPAWQTKASARRLPELMVPLQKDPQDAMRIADAYRALRFDGLLMHLNERWLPRDRPLNEALGLPPELPIIAIPLNSEDFYTSPDSQIPFFRYPIREMMRDVVASLTEIPASRIPHHYSPWLSLKENRIGELAQ